MQTPANSSSNEKPSLWVHEWLAVAIIIGFLIMLTVISRPIPEAPLPANLESHELSPIDIEVSIDGEIELPGKYKLKKGASLQDLLNEAKALPSAELKHLNLKAKLRKGQVVHVPKQAMTMIYLEGAVIKPGPYHFAKGTRMMDLKDHPLFLSEADLKTLNKKRKLKQNEVISIPLQTASP